MRMGEGAEAAIEGAGTRACEHFSPAVQSISVRPDEEDTMRRRLYFIMPDLASARQAMGALLLARIEERHIHFLGKRGTPMDGLHEANVLQKSDFVHGAQVGMAIGAVLGLILGTVIVLAGAGDRWQIATVLGSGIVGALFGTWVASMVGSSVPNSRLRQFQRAIDEGKLLVMVDVPKHRVDEVRALFNAEHPEAEDRGIDPHIPAFP